MSPYPKIAFALAALGIALLQPTAPVFAKAPNIVIIMADEIGYGDIGFNGGTAIPTPGLNRIAAGGVICTQAYVANQNSSANRAALLTGRYPGRFGYERSVAWRPQDPSVGLPITERTLAEVLRPLGYQSGIIGKWHLGAHDNFHPLNRGFDEFYGFLGGGHRSFPEEMTIQYTHEARNEPESYVTWPLRGREPVRPERYLVEDLGLEALDFVRRHADKPFFLYLSYNAPRAPLQARDADIAAFAHIKDEKRRKYAAMISVMDRGIGQLLDLLDYLELTDNTLLVFTSSVGGDIPVTGAYNGAVRGFRGEPWEGGIRVPFAVRWPARLPAGKTFRQPVSTLDVFATVVSANRIPADPACPLDGVDLVPFLRGEAPGPPHERLFQRVYDAGIYVVREGDFKLVKTKNIPTPLLFNLAADPQERTNIADAQPDRAKAMADAFHAWNAQLIAPTVPGVDMREWSQPVRR
jgi:arylsulfatase A-like enzyme